MQHVMAEGDLCVLCGAALAHTLQFDEMRFCVLKCAAEIFLSILAPTPPHSLHFTYVKFFIQNSEKCEHSFLFVPFSADRHVCQQYIAINLQNFVDFSSVQGMVRTEFSKSTDYFPS